MEQICQIQLTLLFVQNRQWEVPQTSKRSCRKNQARTADKLIQTQIATDCDKMLLENSREIVTNRKETRQNSTIQTVYTCTHYHCQLATK